MDSNKTEFVKCSIFRMYQIEDKYYCRMMQFFGLIGYWFKQNYCPIGLTDWLRSVLTIILWFATFCCFFIWFGLTLWISGCIEGLRLLNIGLMEGVVGVCFFGLGGGFGSILLPGESEHLGGNAFSTAGAICWSAIPFNVKQQFSNATVWL